MREYVNYVKVCEIVHKEIARHFIIPQKFGIVKLKFDESASLFSH